MKRFHAIARAITEAVGHPVAFAVALAVITVWAVSGPFLGFSEAWQLTINTGTTIVTFLMVFLIQNAQNHDTHALHAKLDEVLRALPEADNHLRGIEREAQ